MYTIKRAAELTGVNVATLRAWERRYGVVTPHRTGSGYRLYDADAVHAISIMSALVLDGWAPRQAAEETRRRVAAGAEPSGATRPGGQDPAEHAAGFLDPDTDDLVAAAARLDPILVAEVLDRRFSAASFESVVDHWLLPALDALGRAWSEGRVSVAGEHLVAYAVQRRLAAVYEASGSRVDGPRVIVGLPPGARHELGVLAFAVALRRAGVATTYVGADLPAADWASAVETHGAAGVVLSAPRDTDLAGLRAVVADLRAAHPALMIGVGGDRQDDAPEGCVRLGHQIGSAALTWTHRLRG